MSNQRLLIGNCINIVILKAVIVICCLPLAAFAQQMVQKRVVFQKSSDQDIIKKLTSSDKQTANDAVGEVMKRGDRMIPLLMSLKGDHTCFQGVLKLGWWSSGTVRVFSVKPRCVVGNQIVTNELAALFLISAIYHEDVEFSPPPFLCDYPNEDNDGSCGEMGNTTERIAKAWASTEKWLILLREKGMAQLRAEERDPLEGSGVRF